ncbi:MAG TPA: autoinducer binding domain-containing protein [Xanthobacteraceae bacterium]|nr:autoinducer binding domain-containing protein [Xanthobacteraceae bacterium]
MLGAAECAEHFRAIIRQIGFAACACGAWAGVGRTRRHRFFFVDWPPDWLEFYERGGFFHHDMLAIEARRRVSAMWVSSLMPHLKLTPKQLELVEAFDAYGWKDVFAVPIHGPGSLQGLITMATRTEVSLGAADCAMLEILARFVWERCRTSEGFGISNTDHPRLSLREIECLQWAAAGKSDNDIATLLGIKPATAHFHVEAAKRRLGVRTRIEAVAVGILHGLI